MAKSSTNMEGQALKKRKRKRSRDSDSESSAKRAKVQKQEENGLPGKQELVELEIEDIHMEETQGLDDEFLQAEEDVDDDMPIAAMAKSNVEDVAENVVDENVVVDEEKQLLDEENIPIAVLFRHVGQRLRAKTGALTKEELREREEKRILKEKEMEEKKENRQKQRRARKDPDIKYVRKYWGTLEHNGVMFAPPYEPHGVKMLYKKKPVDLTPEQEEIATMFAVMKDTEYYEKEQFRNNFWEDWKAVLGPDHRIKKLRRCDFSPIFEWYLQQKEKQKLIPPEEKRRIKEEKAELQEKFMWATVDGVKERIGNFRVEPPGLFRGRGEHPKMGKLKKRIFPEDVTINISEGAPVPETLPGHNWKEVVHNPHVTWLAAWADTVTDRDKYVFLHASSKWKAESDTQKYEKARMLKECIGNIREAYTRDFSSPDRIARQLAVAVYLIDKLALRAGNEKDEDEADTIGCCSLKVENVTLTSPDVVEFDFLGKDSIRYCNTVNVDEAIFEALQDFQEGKEGGDDLFEAIDTAKLNQHLKKFMPGLSAKVFRTYNASYTLDVELAGESGISLEEKVGAYHTANKQVAVLCNHQRAVSKSHSSHMERLQTRINQVQVSREELMKVLDEIRKGNSPPPEAKKTKPTAETLGKKIDQLDKTLAKLELEKKLKEDMKTVALGTSKINYMDPRITVAWCKRNEVPIEKVFNKALLAKFSWAMDVEPEFLF